MRHWSYDVGAKYWARCDGQRIFLRRDSGSSEGQVRHWLYDRYFDRWQRCDGQLVFRSSSGHGYYQVWFHLPQFKIQEWRHYDTLEEAQKQVDLHYKIHCKCTDDMILRAEIQEALE